MYSWIKKATVNCTKKERPICVKQIVAPIKVHWRLICADWFLQLILNLCNFLFFRMLLKLKSKQIKPMKCLGGKCMHQILLKKAHLLISGTHPCLNIRRLIDKTSMGCIFVSCWFSRMDNFIHTYLRWWQIQSRESPMIQAAFHSARGFHNVNMGGNDCIWSRLW